VYATADRDVALCFYTAAVSRLFGLVSAFVLLAGCESESSPDVEARRGVAVEKPSACRKDDVRALATTLSAVDPWAQRIAVGEGLTEACTLPGTTGAFFELTGDAVVADERRIAAAAGELEMVSEICGQGAGTLDETTAMAPRQRAVVLFDRCGLGRFGLVEREAWLRTGATSVVPFVALHWLRGEGVAEADARTIATAMLLRSRKVWGADGQRVPVVGGVLPPVPHDAIAVAVTPKAVLMEGASVVRLDGGAVPRDRSRSADALRRALQAEREARSGDEDVPVVLVPEADASTATLLWAEGVLRGPSSDEVGVVVQTEPLEFGLLALDIFLWPRHGYPKLEVGDREAVLRPADGGPGRHIDVDALATAADDYVREHGNDSRVIVHPRRDLQAGLLLTTVHRLRGERCAATSSQCKFGTVSIYRDLGPESLSKGGILAAIAEAAPQGSLGFADEEDVWGGLTGTEVGEAFGVGDTFGMRTSPGGGGTSEGTIGSGGGKVVPRVRQSKATVVGPLDKAIIRRIVRSHINEVRHCYNKGLTKDPKLEGTVTVSFTIGASGSVTESKVKSTTLGDVAVGKCIATAAKRWKYPKPKGGGVVVVTYPFALSPG